MTSYLCHSLRPLLLARPRKNFKSHDTKRWLSSRVEESQSPGRKGTWKKWLARDKCKLSATGSSVCYALSYWPDSGLTDRHPLRPRVSTRLRIGGMQEKKGTISQSNNRHHSTRAWFIPIKSSPLSTNQSQFDQFLPALL